MMSDPAILACSNTCSVTLQRMHTWDTHDPTRSRPLVAPLERCAELLGLDLAAICRAAADVEPFIRADGTKVWSLMQLERRLRPDASGRVRGGYLSRRRVPAKDAGITGTARRRRTPDGSGDTSAGGPAAAVGVVDRAAAPAPPRPPLVAPHPVAPSARPTARRTPTP
jgi:hypothetical protein